MAVDKKMASKQDVSGAFDLDAFVGGADGQRSDLEPKRPTKPKSKPKAEQLTERIQVKLTPTEAAKLKERAGLAPISAYVRKFLQDGGLI